MKWPKKINGELDPTGATGGPHNEASVERSVLVLLVPRSWSGKKRRERVVRKFEEGVKDGVPVVVRLVKGRPEKSKPAPEGFLLRGYV